VFYTFLGFQGYQVCNFWPSRLFSRDFTSSGQKQRFENQILINFDSVDRVGGLTCYVASSYWPVPIRVLVLIWALRLDPMVRRRGREMRLTGEERIPARQYKS
jgi:hypothetical protein